MTDRKWVRGANGLWTSYDQVIRRGCLREAARQRIEAIGRRFEEVMKRNGFEKRGNRWRKPKVA
jgi:hypothetical protein